MFNPLTLEDMVGVVAARLKELDDLVADRHELSLHFDDEAAAWLANEGFDPAYGARPLRRLIQRAVMNPLAEKLLAGDVVPGDTIDITTTSSGALMLTALR